jgi:hypothetical protein
MVNYYRSITEQKYCVKFKYNGVLVGLAVPDMNNYHESMKKSLNTDPQLMLVRKIEEHIHDLTDHIKTKNDALLDMKHENIIIRIFCKNILENN